MTVPGTWNFLHFCVSVPGGRVPRANAPYGLSRNCHDFLWSSPGSPSTWLPEHSIGKESHWGQHKMQRERVQLHFSVRTAAEYLCWLLPLTLSMLNLFAHMWRFQQLRDYKYNATLRKPCLLTQRNKTLWSIRDGYQVQEQSTEPINWRPWFILKLSLYKQGNLDLRAGEWLALTLPNVTHSIHCWSRIEPRPPPSNHVCYNTVL